MIKQYCTHWKYEQRILQREPIIYTGQVYFHGQIEEGGWGFIGMLCFQNSFGYKIENSCIKQTKRGHPYDPPIPSGKSQPNLNFCS